MVTPRKQGAGSHWSDDHINFLLQNYNNIPINKLSKILTRRARAVHQMAWKLGLCKRRYRTNEISQERYERIMALSALFSEVSPRHMFRDLRHHERELARIKFAAWAEIHAQGISYSSIARCAGVDHTSILYGLRRHAQLTAQAEAAE